MHIFKSFSFFCCLFLLLSTVYAGGMKVKPGLWETKTIISMPLGGGTRESTSQECIEQSEVTPEQLMKDVEDCDVTNISVDESTMQWSISCSNAGVVMVGTGNATSKESSISGGMNFKAEIEGQLMEMSTRWEGRHIGACP